MTRRERIAWVLLILAALVMRFWALGAKPPHHDEAIHGHFGEELLRTGEYHYDPTYHGPLIYYLEAAIFAVAGESEVTIRIYPALAGVLLVALPLLLRRRIGPRAAWWCGLLVAISPSFLYFSRFGREDIPAALYTAGALVAFALVRRGGARFLPWVGVMAALHAVTKETIYVTLPLILAAAAAVAVREGVWDALLRTIIWLRRNSYAVGTAILWFVIITVTAFTVFFTHPKDALFPVRAISYWYGQHEIQRVGGPWYYYLPRLALYEFLPLGAAIAWVTRRRGRLRPLETFCLTWGLAGLAMYAFLGEKVPWLVVHQVLPFIPLAGMQVARSFGPHGRWLSRSLVAIGLAGTLWSAVALSYLYPTITTADPHAELLVFVQTTPEENALAREGLEIAARTGADPVAAVHGEATWPLSWQWVHLKVYWGLPSQGMRPPLVICDPANQETLEKQLGGDYRVRHVPLRAWWVEEWRGVTPWEIVRWFLTRRAWSPVGATEIVVFERSDVAAAGRASGE
ncbi:MAG: flippase activity-associated protein Agl23 [Acidobacteriota bacterium]